MERKALIKWESAHQNWILYLWIDGEWSFSKSWRVEHKGIDETVNTSIDFVSDSILCEIANLQNLDYTVEVRC